VLETLADVKFRLDGRQRGLLDEVDVISSVSGGSFPISRAVTAYSAVPVLFNSVILRNYAGTCPFELPPWAKEAGRSAAPSSRISHLVKQMMKYKNSEQLQYLHLLDGGLADNLGIRPFLNRLAFKGFATELKKGRRKE
jgi:NTE family protein